MARSCRSKASGRHSFQSGNWTTARLAVGSSHFRQDLKPEQKLSPKLLEALEQNRPVGEVLLSFHNRDDRSDFLDQQDLLKELGVTERSRIEDDRAVISATFTRELIEKLSRFVEISSLKLPATRNQQQHRPARILRKKRSR